MSSIPQNNYLHVFWRNLKFIVRCGIFWRPFWKIIYNFSKLNQLDAKFLDSFDGYIPHFDKRLPVHFQWSINTLHHDWITATLCLLIYLSSMLAPLQRVLNAAVRLVHDLGPREHVTPVMYELHWLPIAERIKFKLCLLVFHAVNGRAPSYLTELVTPVAKIPGRASLCSAGRHDLVVPRSRLVSPERRSPSLH